MLHDMNQAEAIREDNGVSLRRPSCGAGHSAVLRQCVQVLPGWQLVKAVDDLPR